MTRDRSQSALVGAPALLLFFSLGFDLDRGELKCEQAAVHLSECCPEIVLASSSCIQEGGCEREHETTLVAMDESDCLRAETCEELAARGVCERLSARVLALQDPERPSIGTLYEEDWLCD